MADTKTDIIIVDDDEISGRLLKDLLRQAGYSTYRLRRPLDLLLAVRRRKPRLVIMDIVLRGVDGFKLLKTLRDNRETAKTRVIVISEKSFDFEKQQAFKYGAEAFISKPFNVETLAGQITHILDGNKFNLAALGGGMEEEEMSETECEPSDLKDNQVRTRVWGCRGLADSLANSESAWGRQTSCVSVETKDRLIILDGGTGIVPLGKRITERGGPKDIWIFLTHFHIDHIMGLPNFPCLESSAFTLRIAGAGETEKRFKDAVRDIFYASPYWHNRHPRAKLLMYEIAEDSYDLAPDFRLSAMHANHPSPTLCYRLEIAGKKIVYAPDSGLGGDPYSMQAYDEKLGAFSRNADLLIHDSCFTDEEWRQRPGEGHSSPSTAMEFAALQAEAKNLLLFHYNGAYSDETINQMKTKAEELAKENRWSTVCHAAKEGFSLTLD